MEIEKDRGKGSFPTQCSTQPLSPAAAASRTELTNCLCNSSSKFWQERFSLKLSRRTNAPSEITGPANHPQALAGEDHKLLSPCQMGLTATGNCLDSWDSHFGNSVSSNSQITPNVSAREPLCLHTPYTRCYICLRKYPKDIVYIQGSPPLPN